MAGRFPRLAHHPEQGVRRHYGFPGPRAKGHIVSAVSPEGQGAAKLETTRPGTVSFGNHCKVLGGAKAEGLRDGSGSALRVVASPGASGAAGRARCALGVSGKRRGLVHEAGRITTDEAVEVTWEAAVAGGGEASFHARSKATCMILVQKAFRSCRPLGERVARKDREWAAHPHCGWGEGGARGCKLSRLAADDFRRISRKMASESLPASK